MTINFNQDPGFKDGRILAVFGILLLAVLCWFNSGCTASDLEPVAVSSYRIPLSWEKATINKVKPEWSDIIVKELEANLESFEKAKDLTLFCPKYGTLTKHSQLNALGEFVVAVIYHESAYKPTSRMVERELQGVKNPVDPITKRPVASEGHLQLSYQDMQWAKFCKFDWAKDKLLSDTDPKKTIFDPALNLPCGIKIMANQIAKKGLLAPSTGYWAVLNTNSKYQQVADIKARVKERAPGCVN